VISLFTIHFWHLLCWKVNKLKQVYHHISGSLKLISWKWFFRRASITFLLIHIMSSGNAFLFICFDMFQFCSSSNEFTLKVYRMSASNSNRIEYKQEASSCIEKGSIFSISVIRSLCQLRMLKLDFATNLTCITKAILYTMAILCYANKYSEWLFWIFAGAFKRRRINDISFQCRILEMIYIIIE
jgi:hypothetical protein